MTSEPIDSPGGDADDGRRGVGWLVAGVVVALGLGLMLFAETPAPPITRGDPAPPFELPRLDGEGQMGLSSVRGKVAIVNFWATWCKPCEEEMPAMERLYQKLHPQGFELLAISVDEDRKDIERFQRRLQVSFPILLDPDQATSRLYQTQGFPESLLLDTEGRIVERYVGPRQWDHPDYLARVRRLLLEVEGG